MWKSMMVDEYAKQIAKSGGVGVAEQVMQVMIQAQESEK
jgi:Rod binding domain-containing protein